MNRGKLEKLCCEKLGNELKVYKSYMLKKGAEEVYASAYEIDCVVSIYELMVELICDLAEDCLEKLLVFPDLLLFLYNKWMRYEDSHIREMAYCMREELANLANAGEVRTEECAA